MRRKWLFVSGLLVLLLSFSCTQRLNTPPPDRLDVTPLPSVENPMAMIATFGAQTLVAQTEAANPSRPSALDLTQTPAEFSVDAKILYVIFSYASRVSFSLSDLETLPQTTVAVSGQEVKGVALLAILERAGWDADNTVAISLNGIGSLTLPRERIGGDFVLVPAGSSMRFISPSIPENMWVEGVMIIEVY